MPRPTLYFLRSSEQKIAQDMLKYAYRLHELNLSIDEFEELEVFTRFFGFSDKDLGLYALEDNTIVGAIWIRQLNSGDGVNAFISSTIPILHIAVKPQYRGNGVATAMLEQLLLEAGAVYEGISLSVLKDSQLVAFYERFGFEIKKDMQQKSPVDGKIVVTMFKKLTKKEVVRPSDGYDPRRWMD